MERRIAIKSIMSFVWKSRVSAEFLGSMSVSNTGTFNGTGFAKYLDHQLSAQLAHRDLDHLMCREQVSSSF